MQVFLEAHQFCNCHGYRLPTLSVSQAKGEQTRATRHQCGQDPAIFFTNPWKRWNDAPPGRYMKGHSPGITGMPCDSQKLIASAVAAPWTPPRNIQTRLMPASAQSRPSVAVTAGAVMKRAPSTGG